MSDSEAKKKWMRENTKIYSFKVMKKGDKDIIDFLEDKPTATVIKAALREYMINHEGEDFVVVKENIGFPYYVIGGQYDVVCYGGAKSIDAAKKLAAKNDELWDNRQGWHRPSVYAEADTLVIDEDDVKTREAKPDAEPVAWWDGKRWNSVDSDNLN